MARIGSMAGFGTDGYMALAGMRCMAKTRVMKRGVVRQGKA